MTKAQRRKFEKRAKESPQLTAKAADDTFVQLCVIESRLFNMKYIRNPHYERWLELMVRDAVLAGNLLA